jgi:hypothetical protein
MLFLISGDTLGSMVYVPCEVLKQRMQVSLMLYSPVFPFYFCFFVLFFKMIKSVLRQREDVEKLFRRNWEMGCVGVRCYIYCSFIDLETNFVGSRQQ